MTRSGQTLARVAAALVLSSAPVWMLAQQTAAPAAQRGGGGGQPPVLSPARPVTQLFSQDAYTEYALLEPGSASFRIRYLPENSRAGATELVNATRGGSEGSDIEVYDPRTGNPLKFTYTADNPNDPDTHTIHAPFPHPVPEGGIGRVLIFKTYKDDRTYIMNGKDIVWVRSLNGYRLGVILPKGFAFVSSDVAAQLSTTADGRLRIAFANPSGQSNPVTIHATPSTITFPPLTDTDMFFDDIKTLYDLGDEGHVRVEQTYSDYRKGNQSMLDSLNYLALTGLQVVDLDTAKALTVVKSGKGSAVVLEEPIVNDRQSAHLKITGTLDAGYRLEGGELVFNRTLHGLRNTVLLPAGYDVSAVSQSGTIGRTTQGRIFVALINLNAENTFSVTIRARKR
jgi:hypothetical protein